MGLILDSSILIAGERRGETVRQMMQRIVGTGGDAECALSAISIIEVTHGIYRARTDADRSQRRAFADELARDMIVHPDSLAIAQVAGRIEGEQAAKGVSIAVEDLIIGATALHLGFDVATLNVRDFQRIPGLNLVTM
jgi:predicted nucleic acid-binding protein